MNKRKRIAEFARQFSGGGVDARYAGYFALFNQQKFYEAHDLLEDLWLPDRHGGNGNFYKGLIQLAGAFVHLQKDRLKPAAALFDLARKNLAPYGKSHERLNVADVLNLITDCRHELESSHFTINPLQTRSGPAINLMPPAS